MSQEAELEVIASGDGQRAGSCMGSSPSCSDRDWPRAGLIKRARGKGCDLLGLSGTFCL